jgi:hypothetical protein
LAAALDSREWNAAFPRTSPVSVDQVRSAAKARNALRKRIDKNSLDQVDTQFIRGFVQFWEAFKLWASDRAKGRSHRFVPPPAASPFLSLLSAPYEFLKRLEGNIAQLKTSQLHSSFFDALSNGTLVIDPRERRIESSLSYLRKNAGADYTHSKNKCATFVGDAIRSAGIPLAHIGGTGYAANMGPVLLAAGFVKASKSASLEPGDVAIIQPYGDESPAGHAAMWDGTQWISDYKQGGKDTLSPYPNDYYRNLKPDYTIYRLPR